MGRILWAEAVAAFDSWDDAYIRHIIVHCNNYCAVHKTLTFPAENTLLFWTGMPPAVINKPLI